MSRRCNTGKSSTCPNQPHSQEVKDSSTSSKNPFKLPFYFISSQAIERYPPDTPTQPTLDPYYTSSPNVPHQESSSNEEI